MGEVFSLGFIGFCSLIFRNPQRLSTLNSVGLKIQTRPAREDLKKTTECTRQFVAHGWVGHEGVGGRKGG